MPKRPWHRKLIEFEHDLDRMELPVRMRHAFDKAQILTLSDLAHRLYEAYVRSGEDREMNAEDLLLDGFGARSLENLDEALRGMGWTFDLLVEEHMRRTRE